MHATHALGIDVGTSKICVALVELRARAPEHVATVENAALPTTSVGRHEQSPQDILERVSAASRDVLARSGLPVERIAGVAITGQMHGVLLVDPDLTPIAPLITWRDRRTEGACLASLCRRLPKDYERQTGCRLHSGYGGVTLAWRLEQAEIGANCMALTAGDFLAAELCGVIATDLTHAASWGLLHLQTNDWHDGILQALGIRREHLPKVRRAPARLGRCLPKAAERLGVLPGVPVTLPIGDNQASVLGAADGDLSTAVINLGTGGQISLPARTIRVQDGIETRPLPGGCYLHVGASLCGGWSYAYLCQFLRQAVREIGGINLPAETVYQRMASLLERTAHTTLALDPRFTGSRGFPTLRGSLTGIDADNLTPGQLARAFLEGMVRELFEQTDDASRTEIRQLVATGNAARRNPILLSIIEEQFGLPCRLAPHPEEAALGAVLASLPVLRTEGV